MTGDLVKLVLDRAVTSDRVKLIGKKAAGIYEVRDVRGGAFRTEYNDDTDKVFVYGREVDDFRSVDYEAISMLNVSATQEIYRQLTSQDGELKEQASQIAALNQRIAELEQRAAEAATKFASIENVLQEIKAKQPKAKPVATLEGGIQR